MRVKCGGIILLTWLAAVYANQLALLAGTLRTFQQHACDGTSLTLLCPNQTTIDIAIAHYGRPRTHTQGGAEGGAGGVGGVARTICPPLPHHSPQGSKGVCEYPKTVNYNTLQLVVRRCQHKQECTVQVTPGTFSKTDPCPATRKYIEVAYKCRPKTFINKVVCEGGELVVRCDQDARIAIYSVLFGRSLAGSFTCPQPQGVAEEECQASYANEIVMRQCHGQRECHLEAKAEVFGSPCSKHSHMYMKTVYTCVPKKILKDTKTDEEKKKGREGDEEEEMQGGGGGAGDGGGGGGERQGRRKGGHEEGSLQSPAVPPQSPPSSSSSSSSSPHQHLLSPSHHTPTTSFYNPTVTTWLADRKNEERPISTGGRGAGGGGEEEEEEEEEQGSLGEAAPPPALPATPSEAELINCTVLVLAGAPGREIGFLTEWMKAVAFVRGNFEKFLLYLLLGLCVGLVVFLFVVVGQLLWERRRAKRANKTLHDDPLTSVFAAGNLDIDDIDADLDLDGTGGSVGGLVVVGGGSLPRSPSPQDSHRGGREVVRYNAYSTYGRRREGGGLEESDGNPLSLTRTNNNQLFYS